LSPIAVITTDAENTANHVLANVRIQKTVNKDIEQWDLGKRKEKIAYIAPSFFMGL
jgi:hypothetical protein